MNKDGLGALVGTKLGLNKKEGIATVEAVFEAIREGLQSENLVDITKEIKFSLVDTEACIRRNPQTGLPVEVAAGQKLKIKPQKNFKDLT